MSVFAANKKYISQAMQYMYMAQGVQEEQQDIDFGRQLLSNIRQMRIQQAAMDVQSQGRDGIVNTGFTAARQGLQTQFTQPYQQATEDYERQEEIAGLQAQANQAIKKYKKQAKTARTTGYLTAAAATVATVLTAGATSPLAAAAWGAAATAGTMAAGSMAGADRNFQGGAVKGGLMSTAVMATAAGAGFLGGTSGAAAEGAGSGFVSYTLPDGGATIIAATPPSTSWTASQWLAAGKIASTIGGAVKDINNYEVKLPVSQAYTGQNYSQYVQSFRGFA